MDQQTRMLVITADGLLRFRASTGLESLQQAVGGWIAPFTLAEDALVYFNEEWKLYNLPVNTVATRLVHAVRGHGEAPIHGDVVIIGTRSWCGIIDGEDHDCPRWVWEAARKATEPTLWDAR